MRIMEVLNVKTLTGIIDLDKYLEKFINSQNLQSTSCIKAIGSFLRNANEKINDDDLSNPLKTYQTTIEFLKYDIEQYRA